MNLDPSSNETEPPRRTRARTPARPRARKRLRLEAVDSSDEAPESSEEAEASELSDEASESSKAAIVPDSQPPAPIGSTSATWNRERTA